MAEQMKWEYRVVSIGSMWGTKAAQIEIALNEMGAEGWEVVSAGVPPSSGKLLVVAKRPLSISEGRKRRVWPASA